MQYIILDLNLLLGTIVTNEYDYSKLDRYVAIYDLWNHHGNFQNLGIKNNEGHPRQRAWIAIARSDSLRAVKPTRSTESSGSVQRGVVLDTTLGRWEPGRRARVAVQYSKSANQMLPRFHISRSFVPRSLTMLHVWKSGLGLLVLNVYSY